MRRSFVAMVTVLTLFSAAHCADAGAEDMGDKIESGQYPRMVKWLRDRGVKMKVEEVIAAGFDRSGGLVVVTRDPDWII